MRINCTLYPTCCAWNFMRAADGWCAERNYSLQKMCSYLFDWALQNPIATVNLPCVTGTFWETFFKKMHSYMYLCVATVFKLSLILPFRVCLDTAVLLDKRRVCSGLASIQRITRAILKWFLLLNVNTFSRSRRYLWIIYTELRLSLSKCVFCQGLRSSLNNAKLEYLAC